MSNTAISPAVHANLYVLFNAMQNQGGFTPVQAGNAVKGNSRFGRELLGLLQQAGLASEDTDGAVELDHWASATEALSAFEDAFGKTPTSSSAAKADKPRSVRNGNAANTPCGCGCGKGVAKGRTYLPGHDARHASAVARTIAADPSQGGRLLALLPSPALREKARAQAARITGQVEKGNQPVSPKPVWVADGVVKVGRWEYPARKRGVQVQRNTKRDGSGEWVAV